MNGVLPDAYRNLSDGEMTDRIRARKREYGRELTILGHHYQRREIVELADHRGDSYGLSKTAATQNGVRYIVFCGVHFMAESAEILAREGQVVLHPDTTAGCPMADMADIEQVENAWAEITSLCDAASVIPITYINSDADLKAFCGRNGGLVCTSSNAKGAMAWAFERGEKVFFFPDEHLGRNTANAKGIPRERMILWDPQLPFGGRTEAAIRHAAVILWKGYCHVHTWFTVDHIAEARRKYPGCLVIVHPECREEVVAAADRTGSTGFIVREVEQAPAGSVIAIGTEINLISRLAHEHPDKTIVTLSRSLCPNMWKISLNDLLYSLDRLGEVGRVQLPSLVKEQAYLSLSRMLQVA